MVQEKRPNHACPNGRAFCIAIGWEAARQVVEGFPNKDHRAYADFDAAYAYMDLRGCQRPHNMMTLEHVKKLDRKSRLPDGWDVNAYGPYRYDPDEKQIYPSPMQPTTVAGPSNHRPHEHSRFLSGRRPTKYDELRAMARELRKNDGFLELETDGDLGSSNPGDDIHATVKTMQGQISLLLQAFTTIEPSAIANAKTGHPGLASSEQTPTLKEEPHSNDQAPTIKQEPTVNEPAPAMHNDAALSHKLFIAGTPPLPDDDFHHEPLSYEDDDSCSDSGSDLGSDYDSSDEDDQMDEVADDVCEPYQDETSDSSSAPSSQETAEVVSTPPSSPIRRRRSEADDAELDEPPSKKARSSSIALQPDVVTHIKSEDNTQPADHLVAQYESDSASDSGSEYDSESEIESQSDEPPKSETNLHVETLHYSVADKMDCLRELVSLLRKPDGVDLSISGTELATSANGTGKGTAPPSFHGKSLKTADYGKVRLAVIELFKHYSSVVAKSERKVDVVVL